MHPFEPVYAVIVIGVGTTVRMSALRCRSVF